MNTNVSPLRKLIVPKLSSLNNFYPYYDPNIDATLYIPNGWTVEHDFLNAGWNPSGVEDNYNCSSNSDYYKDPSSCGNKPQTFDISIIPPNSGNTKFRLSLDGPTNGFGGSCGGTVNNPQFDFFEVPVVINGLNYTVTTARSKTVAASYYTSLVNGNHEDCFYWPAIYETGKKSIWKKYIVRHWSQDDVTFIIMMQILENIKFH